MNKKALLLIPTIFMVASCEWPIFGFNSKNNENNEQDDNNYGDVNPDTLYQHAVSITGDPNAPFYLKVGEKRTLQASLSPTPTKNSERTFTWNCGSTSIVSVTRQSNTAKADVVGLKEGKASISAINDYNADLKKYFTANVIKFDEENNYLWQYKTEDRAQFGYNSKNTPLGIESGTAVLNGKNWDFRRSNLSSLQSSHGAVGFGKSAAPETSLHFETDNKRIIDKIVIEASSAKAQGKMTLKVGDITVFDDKVVPDTEYDVIGSISSNPGINASGKISIDVDTPEYDPSRADDPNYLKPGAFFLKSILIYYKEETITTLRVAESSSQKVDYFTGEVFSYEGLALEKVTDRGTVFPVDIEKEMEDGKLSIIPPSIDIADHNGKNVQISLKVDGYDTPFKTSYPIHVRSDAWVPESIEVYGDVTPQGLIAGDFVDYSGLKIKVIYDSSCDDTLDYPFEDFGIFTYSYGLDEDPFVAETAMNEGFTINVLGHFVPNEDGVRGTTCATTYTVPSGILTVQEAIYDRIDFRKTSVREALDLKTDKKQVSYTSKSGNVEVNFDSVKKGYRLLDHYELPVTSSNFDIIVKNKDYTIDKLNIEFANATMKDNPYRLSTGVFGGDIYGDVISTADKGRIVQSDFDEYTNSALLQPGLYSTGSPITSGICVVSILVRYEEHQQATFEISANGTTPTKKSYIEGEVFDPSGIVMSLTSPLIEEPIDVTKYFTWYDGATYKTAPQFTLTPESTYVVGVYHGLEFKFALDNVEAKAVNLEIVMDASTIDADSKYYLVARDYNLISLGTAKGKYTSGSGAAKIDDTDFKQTASINILYENDYYSIIPQENGKFVFSTTTGNTWGLTKGGNTSNSSTCPYQEFSIEIDSVTGVATININIIIDDEGVQTTFDKTLGCSGTLFNLYDTSKIGDKLCVSLYRVID